MARRRWARAVGALIVVVLAALAGAYAVAGLAPERLRQEVETLLAEVTRAPVSLGSLRLVVGFPMRLEGQDITLYDGALRMESAAARVSPLSLLLGKPRLSAFAADGIELTLTRNEAGRWEPDFDPSTPPLPIPTREPLLGPLEIFERTARELLARPSVADRVAISRAQVRYVDGPTGRERARLAGLRGELIHRSLRGDAELRLAADLSVAGVEPAAVEAEGIRTRDGAVDLSLAVTGLDLRAFDPGRGRSLRGSVSGILDLEGERPGEADLALDLVVEQLATSGPLGAREHAFETRRFAARLRAALSPLQLDVGEASISAGPLEAKLAATFERPIDADSHLGLTLLVEDVDVERARAISGWLPEDARAATQELLERVRAGRLARVEARGGASLDEWSHLLDGHARAMPWGMRLATDVEDLALEFGPEDSVDGITGSLVWTADRLEAQLEQGRFNGDPLPELDAEIHGVSHLFASEPLQRELMPGAQPLPGLVPLWEKLWGGKGDSDEAGTTVTLDIDYLHHPAVLWPIEALHARIQPAVESTRVDIVRAAWAGTPLSGHCVIHADESRVALRLVASEPPEFVGPLWRPHRFAAPTEAGRIWAKGRFEVGAIDAPAWRQHSARGAFQAAGDEVDIPELTVALAPEGELRGAGWLELGIADRAHFQLEASVEGGEAGTIMEVLARSESLNGGRVDAEISLSGALAPRLPLVARLAGEIEIQASDGSIRASVPAIVALALATDTLNAFDGHDEVRYDTIETVLRFGEGKLSTEAFDLDGPDLRLFVAGEVDLLREPHPVEAELALFLFRHIDKALINIPIVNSLLLGGDDNLVGAYFSLEGPWRDPVATPMPVRILAESPAGSVLTGIPEVMTRGLKALGGFLGVQTRDSAEAPPRRGGKTRRKES